MLFAILFLMETLQKYFFLSLGLALVVWSFYAFLNNPAPAHYQDSATLFVGAVQIPIEIADTNEERALGLSNRESLAEGRGLLFIFEETGVYGFWMKDMKFPIDIVWIDENWVVVGIERRVTPNTYPTTFFPPRPVKYVLELNSEEASRLGIDIGSRLSRNR